MCRYLSCCAAALLLLAGMTCGQVMNLTVDDVLVSLVDTKSSQGEKFTLSSSQHHLYIACRVNSSVALTQGSFFWRKASANTSITQDARTSVATEITNNGLTAKSVLTINYPVKADVTSYVCAVNQTYSATGSFVSAPLLTMTVNGVNEYDTAPWPGDSLTIVCLVEGSPVGSIQWSKSVDPTFNSTSSSISMTSVSYAGDRGFITCSSSNRLGTNSATMFLRIKNPLSYLAPLVATIVELIIMVAVAVGYELYDKRRRRVGDDDGTKSE